MEKTGRAVRLRATLRVWARVKLFRMLSRFQITGGNRPDGYSNLGYSTLQLQLLLPPQLLQLYCTVLDSLELHLVDVQQLPHNQSAPQPSAPPSHSDWPLAAAGTPHTAPGPGHRTPHGPVHSTSMSAATAAAELPAGPDPPSPVRPYAWPAGDATSRPSLWRTCT